ncbi:MAG: Na+/H+ antiporter subunit C [Desulfosoma sp.]|uniref:Na+/H+ antiporter subunit C n=1 Tax=Desulfosoma sp. TaxID=2603217 RepID=UPI00404A53F6
MELLFAAVVGVLTAAAAYLLLERRSFSVVLGLMVLSYAVNLFLFAMGRLHTNKPPLVDLGVGVADPVPQALVLTAIVIGFAMTAFALVLALHTQVISGSDDVDDPAEE